jgi:hypothetical protein
MWRANSPWLEYVPWPTRARCRRPTILRSPSTPARSPASRLMQQLSWSVSHTYSFRLFQPTFHSLVVNDIGTQRDSVGSCSTTVVQRHGNRRLESAHLLVLGRVGRPCLVRITIEGVWGLVNAILYAPAVYMKCTTSVRPTESDKPKPNYKPLDTSFPSQGLMVSRFGVALQYSNISTGWWVGPSSPRPMESCVIT